MDKKGPGSLRGLGFEGLHPPFINSICRRARLFTAYIRNICAVTRLETGPRHQQNCTDCHKENARPVRSEPQESHAAPWRLQSVANRPGGIRAAKRSAPNSSACHVQGSAENEQRAKSYQEHSRLSIIAATHNRTGIQAVAARFVPCVYRKLKLGRSGGEVRPGSGMKR
jgi:hypothetical protein